jgi:hypothetical protein
VQNRRLSTRRPRARTLFALPTITLLAALAALVISSPASAGPEEPPPDTAPETTQPLAVDTSIVYDVLPANQSVHVSVNALATNQNPEHVRREVGNITYYRGYDLYLPVSATNVVAANSSGGALEIAVEPLDEFFNQVAVFFDARFFFGETYAFSLSYDLPAQRESNLVISENYLYFPAFADGTSSNVTINIPPDAGFEATVENPDCAPGETEGSFNCAVVDPLTFLAWVEVVREGALGTLESTVQMQDTSINVVVEYFEGEDAWANEISSLIAAALPVLERLNGHSYAGPSTVTIREAARTETEGYAGRAQATCETDCVIQLLPVTSDFVALHESSHLWSNIFSERWLYEGFADWTATKALEELGIEAEPTTPNLSQVAEPEGGLQLINWVELECPPLRCPDNREYDLYGYARSLAFIETLEERVGPEALVETNALVATGEEPVGARQYMNAIEQVTGENLDAEFLEWVFTPEDEPALQQRRAARDDLQALTAQLEGTDLVLPSTIAELIDDWEFDQALELIPRASEVIPVYEEASAMASGDRSFFENIGLLMDDDPDDSVEAARVAFSEGRFDDAAEESQAAIDAREDAETAGQQRVIIGAILIAVALAGLGFVLWSAGRGKVHRSPYHL